MGWREGAIFMGTSFTSNQYGNIAGTRRLRSECGWMPFFINAIWRICSNE
jgi:hypothetical protein